ncbi:Major facilitator superfamily domain, general substrate transporter [Penicillium digitatum]|uniref:Major facilitator superfamily domain, general substrate transporter n=1 Tax=Penicillium digitatum TaxID=36651 RepID=A0A7T6XVI3_PENDI|nr:Major facilitator superfamily domain, general substrate transporter [Penicillium digitatum]
MAFGILEPSRQVHPSRNNNVLIMDAEENNDTHLKLMPLPSNSPSDPLNWTRLKKELLFATIIFGSCATGSLGPVLVPGFTTVAAQFETNLRSIALLNGALVMASGVSAYLCSCFAGVYGKRSVFIATTILLIVSCCWAAASKSYHSLLTSRIFQGLGIGAFFALAGTSSINDVFFVHERGIRVGLWNFGVIISVNLTPVVSGYVISNLSWRWSFWLEMILFSTLLISVIFLFPETTFCREDKDIVVVGIQHTPKDENSAAEKMNTGSSLHATSEEPRCSWWSSTFAFSQVKSNRKSSLLMACIKPLYLIWHPIAIWGCLMWSVTFTWAILLGAVVSQIFVASPYNMSTVGVGNLSGIAPFIGSAIGTVVSGWLCDFLAKEMTRRNSGLYEPEFRLVVIFPTAIAMAVGSFGLGAAIENELSFIVCGVFMAILNFAIGMGCTSIVTYTNDVFAERAGDAFGLAMLSKSVFAFGLIFVFNDYYARIGPLPFFSTFGAVSLGVMVTTVPVYIFGKRIRYWADKGQNMD